MSQRLARPRRRSDRVGHQDRELPRLHPDDVAHRQPRADPHILEEHLQNTDDLVALQCTARHERQQRGTIMIGNPVHRAFEPTATHLTRVTVTPVVYPRVFEFTTLTFRALHGNHMVTVTRVVYPRLFSSTLTLRALHGHLATLRESWLPAANACLRIDHLDIQSTPSPSLSAVSTLSRSYTLLVKTKREAL